MATEGIVCNCTNNPNFAKCRFSFRKLQIFILFRSISFCFAPFRFANYSKPRRSVSFPSSQSPIKFTLLCSLNFLCCLPWYLLFSSLRSLVPDLLHHELAAKSWDLPVRVYRLFIIWLASWVTIRKGKPPNSVLKLTSQLQFSMVCTLSNDVKMLTTQVKQQATGEWFHCNKIRILWGCKMQTWPKV